MNTNAVSSKSSAHPDIETVRFRLDNGLNVVIREDHFAPVVAQQVWVTAGGADESDIEAGVAHVHEHMLFKGTERRGVGAIAAAVESSGGQINAWTSWDHTVYHLVLASRFAAEGIDILADAMQHSSFDPNELAKELDVVLEEWKRAQDSPSNRLFDAMFDAAYTKHTYGRPVIGTESSIRGLTRQRILDFYHRYYSPQNMTLIVVGDVDAAAMRREIEAKFGAFEKRDTDRPRRAKEPRQRETRFAAVAMDVQESQLALGFHIPDANDDDTPALDLLAHVLGGGESSRLYRRLVAQGAVATSASAFAYTPPDPGLFLVTASFEPSAELEVSRGLLEELARVRDFPVEEAELARARANLESDFVYRRQTVQGQARELGYSIVIHGDADYPDRYVEALRRTTAADLQKVARTYLARENLTGVALRPEDAPRSGPNAVDLASLGAAAAVLDSDRAVVKASKDAGALPPPRVHVAGEDGDARLVRLANGVRVIVQEHHAVPMFSVRAAVLGGLLAETATDNGISNFVAEMLTRGTERRSREQLAADVESLAGELGGFSGRSSFGVAGTFLSEHFDEGIDLTMEVLRAPAFPAEEVEITRRELLLAIKSRADETAQRAFDLAYRTVYPDHPYGMTTLGEAESINRIGRDELLSYYRGVLDPESLVVTVVGDVDAGATIAKLEAALSGLRGDGVPFRRPAPAAPIEDVRRARLDTNRKQSHVVVAFRGAAMADPDRYALSVLDTVLAGQGGRLFYELRDKRALAYAVTSFSAEGYDPGLYGGYIATDPANEGTALEGLIEQFELARTTDISQEELERAQRYLVGNYEIALQTNSAIAENMTFNELYGLGYLRGREYADRIRAVDVEAVRAAAGRFLDLDRRSEAVVGPPR